MPGKSGNPYGRPKRVDPLSQRLQGFYNKHQQDIEKVGELVIRKALDEKEPWAVKLCMEYFFPKPGRSVAITKEETTAVNVNLSSFTQALSFEDKQTFLKMWMKSKRGIPAFSAEVEGNCVEVDAEVLEGSKED